MFPTKNQSVIRKQKVMLKAFVCRPLLPYPHTEAYLQAPFTKVEIILLKASITIRKSKRDNISPYLKLQELPKKRNEVPFINTESALKINKMLSNCTIYPQIRITSTNTIKTPN
jgi:hypothetical protein